MMLGYAKCNILNLYRFMKENLSRLLELFGVFGSEVVNAGSSGATLFYLWMQFEIVL